MGIIFLGDEEKKILDALYKKTENISENMGALQLAINDLEKSAIECNKQIHATCDILIGSIHKKRKNLLAKVEKLKTKRRQELDKLLEKLQKMNEVAKASQDECEEVAAKSDISSTLRLEQMNASVNKCD